MNKIRIFAKFLTFLEFEKWKFLINDSLPELFLIRIRIWDAPSSYLDVLQSFCFKFSNLSFLRLIVKRTKTKKVDFRFRTKVIELLSRSVKN